MISIPAKGQLSGYFIKCENCGKEIYQTKTQYNRAKHHFCSGKCQKDFQHKQCFENRECPICGNIFYVRKKDTQKFCSVACQNEWQKQIVGENNPNSIKPEMDNIISVLTNAEENGMQILYHRKMNGNNNLGNEQLKC